MTRIPLEKNLLSKLDAAYTGTANSEACYKMLLSSDIVQTLNLKNLFKFIKNTITTKFTSTFLYKYTLFEIKNKVGTSNVELDTTQEEVIIKDK